MKRNNLVKYELINSYNFLRVKMIKKKNLYCYSQDKKQCKNDVKQSFEIISTN